MLVIRLVLVIVRVDGIMNVVVTGTTLVMVRVVSIVLIQVDVTSLLEVTRIVTVTVHACSVLGISKVKKSRYRTEYISI